MRGREVGKWGNEQEMEEMNRKVRTGGKEIGAGEEGSGYTSGIIQRPYLGPVALVLDVAFPTVFAKSIMHSEATTQNMTDHSAEDESPISL